MHKDDWKSFTGYIYYSRKEMLKFTSQQFRLFQYNILRVFDYTISEPWYIYIISVIDICVIPWIISVLKLIFVIDNVDTRLQIL